jgi:hypothetical protein
MHCQPTSSSNSHNNAQTCNQRFPRHGNVPSNNISLYSFLKLLFKPHLSATAQAVTVALPVLPVTVFLPSTQTGPIPSRLFATVTVSSSQPPQSIFEVRVLGGTVIVHPKGEVEVTVLVQVGDAEQAVIFVVPGRVVGGQIWDGVSLIGDRLLILVGGGCVLYRSVDRG